MTPKDPKNQKKPKKPLPRLPKLPKDANVKIIEITPRTFLIPVIVLVLLYVVFSFVRTSMSDEVIDRNTKIGLNEIVAAYNS